MSIVFHRKRLAILGLIVSLKCPLSPAIAEKPDDPQDTAQWLYSAAQELIDDEQYQLAKNKLKQALFLAPDHILSLILSGELFAILEDGKRAEAYLRHAEFLIDETFEIAAEERLKLAENYVRIERFTSAERLLDNLLAAPELNPTSKADRLIAARAYVILAKGYMEQGQIDKSQRNFLAADQLVSELDQQNLSVREVRNEWLDEIASLEEVRGDLDSASKALLDLMNRLLNS